MCGWCGMHLAKGARWSGLGVGGVRPRGEAERGRERPLAANKRWREQEESNVAQNWGQWMWYSTAYLHTKFWLYTTAHEAAARYSTEPRLAMWSWISLGQPLLENSWKVSATLRKHQQHWGHSPTRFLLRSLITSTTSLSRWTELRYRLHNCCKSVIEGNWISASESLCMIPRVWDKTRTEVLTQCLRQYYELE